MSISSLPVDQRVIDIDSRRFSSIEKALVELITNSDDSYSRLEAKGAVISDKILISYERHQNGAVLTVTDHAEGMAFNTILSVLSYGGAHSLMAKGEAGGRGYFGRGMKQAIYGLGHGWIESINEGVISRVDLFRGESGEYLFDDWNSGREVNEKDYKRLNIAEGYNGTRVTVIVENPLANIPYFSSLSKTITNNIYLRDILNRRKVELININQSSKIEASIVLDFNEPKSRILIGPDEVHTFNYNGRIYSFCITLKKALDRELVLRGNERTNGLLVISGTAVFDCQFFKYENQLGTEYLYGAVNCPGLVELLAKGNPIISDEREGLNMKDPFVSAFSDAVSEVVSSFIKNEQLRLSHVDHATTSKRTQDMIENILKKMNQVASEDLGIILPPGPGTGTYGPFDTGRPAVLRFSTPFYYRKVNKKFNATLIIDKTQLLSQDIISFNYNLGESIKVEPLLSAIIGSEIPEDGRIQFQITGSEIGKHGKIEAVSGPYAAACEIVIAENASGQGYGHPSGKPNRPWNMDNSTALFRGYELRNLSNDMDRAVYSPSERLILINTEAPTVRLYVNGQGHFKDGARLLLAELLLDVIAEELAKYYIDRTDQKGESEAYRQAKQDIIRRYGVEVHSVLMGE